MPDRPFRCLDEQVRHSFHFCYSDKVERDWTRSNTAYRESSPNEHPHVGAENSLQINHSPVSLPGSSFLENIFLFRSGKIFAQISHSRTILITFTPELYHILKKNLKSLFQANLVGVILKIYYQRGRLDRSILHQLVVAGNLPR